MRKTIYLPDDLAARVEEHLKLHPNMTLSSLVQQSLEREVSPRDRSAILKLIGLVPADTPRRYVPIEDRQPEDQVIDLER